MRLEDGVQTVGSRENFTNPLPRETLNDPYIVVMAKAYHFKVVTRNAKDFKRTGVGEVNLFEDKTI